MMLPRMAYETPSDITTVPVFGLLGLWQASTFMKAVDSTKDTTQEKKRLATAFKNQRKDSKTWEPHLHHRKLQLHILTRSTPTISNSSFEQLKTLSICWKLNSELRRARMLDCMTKLLMWKKIPTCLKELSDKCADWSQVCVHRQIRALIFWILIDCLLPQ